MSILIQNGTLLCPQGPVQADLRVDGEKIAEIGPKLPVGASQVIDAGGKLVIPRCIDTHTHFEMNKGTIRETADNWESGTKAALAGGTTCVLDFAETARGASLQSALEEWHSRADGHASCHYGFHMTIKDWDPRILEEIPRMTEQGVTSYKVYLAYANIRVSDAVAYQVINAVGKEGGIVGCHCENAPTHEPGKADFSANPGGNPGTEHRPALMYTYGVKSGRITPHQMMLALAQHPAQLFGMFPQKGALQVGSDADIVIFDPNHTWRITA